MQKVVKVSISNIAFTLEQDAHELMQDYLERLQIHYESSPNCGEILSEIESRIAELLSERGYRDKVVPPETVQEIIGILGRPEDFDGESEEEQRTTKKRVYRDPDNKILGGVCGGLGAYFSVDPLIFRIAFAVWVFFFFWLEIFGDWGWGMSVLGMFAYIVLWIAMPEARTVEQRYNMKGGSVSLKDIQKSMRREAGDAGRRVGKGVRDGVRSTGGFWKAMGRCIVICTGILLLLIGMSGSVAGLMAMFGIGIWNSVNAFGLSWMSRPAIHRSIVCRHSHAVQAQVPEMEARSDYVHRLGRSPAGAYRSLSGQSLYHTQHRPQGGQSAVTGPRHAVHRICRLHPVERLRCAHRCRQQFI